jgi:subtilase family serine protease
MAHTMAPGAKILLVETPVAETEGVTGFPQMMMAENHVINNHLGDVITQSFGATEETFPSFGALSDLRFAFKNAAAHNVTVLASSGDDGVSGAELDGVHLYPFRVNSWPSADPLVTSLGGTQLHLSDSGNRFAPDNVWNDQALFGSPAAGGGGLSEFFSKPVFQQSVENVVGTHRGTPDISMSAAVNGAALVFLGFPGVAPGYYLFGGTSEASPLFSGVVADADQAAGHDLGQLGPALYKLGASHAPGVVDVTAGNNTVSFQKDATTVTVPGFDAVRGYDLASGLGTADGAALVHELAGH